MIYDTGSATYRAFLAPETMDLDDDGYDDPPAAAPPAAAPAAKAEAAVEEPPPKPETHGFAVRFAGPVPAGRAFAGRAANGHESDGSGLSTLDSGSESSDVSTLDSDSEGSDVATLEGGSLSDSLELLSLSSEGGYSSGLDLVSAADSDSSPPPEVLSDSESESESSEGGSGSRSSSGPPDLCDTASESSDGPPDLLGGSGSSDSSGPPELLGGSDSESDGSVPSLTSDWEEEEEAQEAPQAAPAEEQGPPRGHADWRDWEALPATVLAVVARKVAAATDASHRRRPKSRIREGDSHGSLHNVFESGELYEPLSSADAECAHGLLPFALVCKAWRRAQLMVGKLRMRTGDVVAEDKVGLLLWALGEAGAPASLVEACREEMSRLFQTEGRDLINPDGTLRDPRHAKSSFLAKVRDVVGGRVRPMTLVELAAASGALAVIRSLDSHEHKALALAGADDDGELRGLRRYAGPDRDRPGRLASFLATSLESAALFATTAGELGALRAVVDVAKRRHQLNPLHGKTGIAVIKTAARLGHLPIFGWLLGPAGLGDPSAWDSTVCALAAEGGHLEVLKLALAAGCPLDATATEMAAKAGSTEILHWARAKGCGWNANACRNAAEYGHLEVLQMLRAEGCPWDRLTCAAAARSGHVEVLRWARENGCPWDAETFGRAAEMNQIEMMELLHEMGCPFDHEACMYAALNGHVESLTWLRARGFPFGPDAPSAAAQAGQLAALQCLRAADPPCPWDDEIVLGNAAVGGHLEMVQWAREHGANWHASACQAAAEGGQLEVLQWLRAEGCPWDFRTFAAAQVAARKEGAGADEAELLEWVRENGCPQGLASADALADILGADAHATVTALADALGDAGIDIDPHTAVAAIFQALGAVGDGEGAMPLGFPEVLMEALVNAGAVGPPSDGESVGDDYSYSDEYSDSGETVDSDTESSGWETDSEEEEVDLALFGLKERPDLVGRRVEHLERVAGTDGWERELVRVLGTGERLKVRQRNLRPVRCECESCMELYRAHAGAAATLRFGVGDRVLARHSAQGPDGAEWKRGTIASLLYRERSFEPGAVAPYQIQLDDSGEFIYAPDDSDDVVRERDDAESLSSETLDGDEDEDDDDNGVEEVVDSSAEFGSAAPEGAAGGVPFQGVDRSMRDERLA